MYIYLLSLSVYIQVKYIHKHTHTHIHTHTHTHTQRHGLPLWLSGKESTWNTEVTGDAGWIPASGEDLLEEGMATHSNILAWRIPWTEEPGGL